MEYADVLHRLLAIKEKLKQQRQHIEDLDKHMSVPTATLHDPIHTHIHHIHYL
jgi:hypothetical protein